MADENTGLKLENYSLKKQKQENEEFNSKTVNARLLREKAKDKAELKKKDSEIEKLKAMYEPLKENNKAK